MGRGGGGGNKGAEKRGGIESGWVGGGCVSS